MRKVIELATRPYHNIRNKEFRTMCFLWVWFVVLIYWSFLQNAIMVLPESASFLFSFRFEEMMNQRYMYFNVAKILFWVFLCLPTIKYLFQKPITKDEV